MDLARYIASDACPRDRLTIPHEDVSLSNYVYSYDDHRYYAEGRRRDRSAARRSGSNHNNERGGVGDMTGIVAATDDDGTGGRSATTIDVISVNTTQILLTPQTLADWHNVDFRAEPGLFLHVLWGHSIRRGKYRRYLVWKQDRSFQQFWGRFMKAYGELVGGVVPPTRVAGRVRGHAANVAGKTADDRGGSPGSHLTSIRKLANK
jgi:hypothetical protein